ncbi:RDD family protein [uncultured Gilvimarinus sp.]|uniref:RDD family protein n=1 Tax=uncultured Gilvimarinus sp. TaxID=1689143 RepID=UPI0030EBA03E
MQTDQEHTHEPTATIADTSYTLAPRAARLFAVIIDTALSLLVVVPATVYFGVWDNMLENPEAGSALPWTTTALLALFGWGVFLVLHGWLLYRRGQTIGKHCVDIAIVTLDGKTPAFVPLLAKRYFLVALIGGIPFIGGFLMLVDVLFIFRSDKRCVHDLIAGTRVVSVAKVSE